MRLFLFTLFIVCITSLFSQNYTWPIQGKHVGEDILYRPQDYIGEEFNFDNLFIGAKENSKVVSPCDGEIVSINQIVLTTLNKVSSIPIPINNKEDFDKLFKQCKGVCASPDTEIKYISTMITISTEKREKIHIWGIKLQKELKTGYILKAGELIGCSGFAYKAIKQPCIGLSISSKTADPMGIFGLKTTFIPPSKNKTDFLTYKHDVDKLKKDFTVFRESLEEGHPGLYDYTPKEEMDKLFDSTYKSITRPMTSEEFRISLLPILNSIRDSHTAIMANRYKTTDDSRPPVLFGLRSDSLVVYSTLPGFSKFLGKRIIKIDHEDVSAILPKINNLLYGNDGFIESNNKRLLLLYFWKYFQDLTGKKNGDTVNLAFDDQSSETFTYGMNKKETYIPEIKVKDDTRFITKNISATIGLVKLNTFWLLETDIDSIGRFVSNPVLEHLIVDVRDNPGGDDEALGEIFSFMALQPFRVQISEMVNKKGGYNLFRNSSNYPPDSRLFENYKGLEGDPGYYLTEEDFPLIQPNKNAHFYKDVYVLVNEYSKSAATIFPALAHKQKLGKIIGRETGSTYYQLNATKFVQVYLENTSLELYMPLVKSIFDKKGDSDIPWGRGVIPDYTVEMDFRDFVGDYDPILNTTLNIISIQDKLNSTKVYRRKLFSVIGISIGAILIIFLISRYFIKNK